MYWNMVLDPTGVSTWWCKQNALITIDKETKKAIFVLQT
jgi:glucosylceramidase